MFFLKRYITPHRMLLILFIVYFFIHITNLTLLPIFNDEAIYLDWAWAHTHMPGHLYDSLLDAKQPLLIWVFGIFERFFPDPLFAGRLVSVLIGFITMIGVYSLSKKIVDKKAAAIAAFLYTIIPIFIFYNRQALMEPAIACIGIWACIVLINLIRSPSIKDSILLGFVLGVGFFIKSSSLLFIVATICVLTLFILIKKNTMLFRASFIAFVTFFFVDFLLFINPLFWETFSSNNRYSFSLVEIVSFPLQVWGRNILGFFEIGFLFMTPVAFLSSIVGMYLFMRKLSKEKKIFLLFFFIAIFLEIIGGKTQSQRYLVSFLPFLVIPASYVFALLWKDNIAKKGIVLFSFVLPIMVSTVLLFHPETYILTGNTISGYADIGYVRGQTSGYGINEVMQYIKSQSKGQPAMVLFALNIGNPESAVDVYAQKSPNLAPMHIDAQLFPDIEKYQCATSDYPVYFITREDQLAGMNRFFVLEKAFYQPDRAYSVRIYTLKKHCTDETFSLSNIYAPAMEKIFQMK